MRQALKILFAGALAMMFSSCSNRTDDAMDQVRIAWDGSTLTELTSIGISGSDRTEINLYYPRIRPLSDGSLLMSLMNHKFGWDVYVTKSWDGGRTWEPASIVRESRRAVSPEGDDVLCYVNPDFIQLADGRVILAWQWRYIDAYHNMEITNDNCGIEISFSDDYGASWSEPREIYRGRCWEPAMLELPSGEIQMYFTDSGEILENGLTKTCTAVLRSFDGGGTWQGKGLARRSDMEPISRTVCYGRGFDGMASAVRLNNGDIIVPLETFIRGHLADHTPVISRTSEKENWRTDYDTLLAKGGPDYPKKSELNCNFIGMAPYCTILDSGEPLIGSNGTYKGKNGYWVFIGDREGRSFGHPVTAFGGFWGNVCYAGGRTVIASSTKESIKDGAKDKSRTLSPRSDGYKNPNDIVIGSIYSCHGIINRSKVVEKGMPELPGLHEFNRNDNSFWFLGKNGNGCLWTDFAYTSDRLILSSYCFDNHLCAYSVPNSDAAAMLLSREGKGTYQILANAAGAVRVLALENNCWRDIYEGSASEIEMDGTLNEPSDEDFGFKTVVSLPWKILGGAPRRGEIIRAHMRRHCKDEKETRRWQIEEQEGEDIDFPQDWMAIKLN